MNFLAENLTSGLSCHWGIFACSNGSRWSCIDPSMSKCSFWPLQQILKSRGTGIQNWWRSKEKNHSDGKIMDKSWIFRDRVGAIQRVENDRHGDRTPHKKFLLARNSFSMWKFHFCGTKICVIWLTDANRTFDPDSSWSRSRIAERFTPNGAHVGRNTYWKSGGKICKFDKTPDKYVFFH